MAEEFWVQTWDYNQQLITSKYGRPSSRLTARGLKRARNLARRRGLQVEHGESWVMFGPFSSLVEALLFADRFHVWNIVKRWIG